MQFCLDPLPHFHHNITPVGLQLAACARQPRLVGHRGRREGRKKKKAGEEVGDSEQLVVLKHLLGGRFWSHLAYSAWQGGEGYSSRGTGKGDNTTRDACGIKMDVLQFTFRSVGL